MNAKERKDKLKGLLGKIVEPFEEIGEIMKHAKRNGYSVGNFQYLNKGHRITHSEKGFSATYENKNGDIYDIIITKVN